MCVTVGVLKRGRIFICETVGDLADSLGVRHKEVSPDPYDNCLCNAYLDELGARRATESEGWPFPVYVIEVKS